MRAVRFLEYTTAGAAAGALFTGLGAVVLHPANPDAFDRKAAGLAGLVGGAASHAVIGLVAAFDRHPSVHHHLRGLGASLPIAAATSGVIGGAILGSIGYGQQPDPGALVIAGLLGGAIVSVAGGVGVCLSILSCAPRPRWTAVASGDLGESDLLDPEAPPEQHGPAERGEHPHHRSLAERLLPFQGPHSV